MNYWENRYKNGGNSGEGSRGNHKKWKWSILDKYIHEIDNIVDVGCGDLAFMKGIDVINYTGIDISQTMINQNKTLKPKWDFICSSADVNINELKGDVVFCHDMLFHILDDGVYKAILENLIEYSNNYISIYTWHSNPLNKWYKKQKKDSYQAYRDFNQYIPMFETAGFKLIANCKSDVNKYGTMYIFKKVTE